MQNSSAVVVVAVAGTGLRLWHELDPHPRAIPQITGLEVIRIHERFQKYEGGEKLLTGFVR